MNSRFGLFFIFMLACVFTGCATVNEGVNYTLFEPSSRLVYYRLSEGDELDLILFDGTSTQLIVEAVDHTFIYSKDGRSIAIEEIQELRDVYTLNLAQELALGTVAIVFYTVAGPLSVLALPVAVPMILLYDEEAVKNWQDNQLCRVSEHPDHYDYSISGLSSTDAEVSVLNQVISEIESRELQCDPIVRAERYCAYRSESGASFQECATHRILSEQDGVVDILAWTDSAICIAFQALENEQESGGPPSSLAEASVARVTEEKLRRELNCEVKN